ncbi:hypothetical protein [Prolixibacter sp. NT017]|uniref:hypothetical protein n=1 Tax=Prolixibacter sp. NT017 TaxID=2652390 RepID=UPI001286760D|nr:hypothetical protein [Prolixibacter sp. NT017]GET26100.1 hypothetical protein NT017_24290 [Prolixibacter sp. NT017]
MKFNILFYISVLFLMSSCASTRLPCPCEASSVILLDDTELHIHSEVILETDSDSTSKGIKIIAQIIAFGGKPLPKGLHAEIYAIRPSDMSFDGYEAKFDKQLTDISGGFMELTALNGPDWKVGTPVDVAVRLADDAGNRKYIKEDKVVIRKGQSSNADQ